VASMSPQGVLYYESEFASVFDSVENYIGLVANVFEGNLSDELINLLDYEQLVTEGISPEGGSLLIGPAMGQFRLYWASCDGACKSGVPTRN
jgi:hypothetical protein